MGETAMNALFVDAARSLTTSTIACVGATVAKLLVAGMQSSTKMKIATASLRGSQTCKKALNLRTLGLEPMSVATQVEVIWKAAAIINSEACRCGGILKR